MKRNIYYLSKCMLILTFAALCNMVFAQRNITGTITDEQTAEPLIGANIFITGTNAGTVTDLDGNYSLQVPEGGTELIISFTGYADKIIDLSSQPSNVINLSLRSGKLLDEVVVIGYGTVKKEDATGSIQTISTKDFNKGSITSPQELLSGKIAGVQITTGGDPGGGSVIRIRGGSSLSATNDPLIVIDGVPVDNGGISGSRNPLNVINPNDIETFTVLKDASATAIYGSRASNGVILITTKKGKFGKKIRVDYNGNISFSNNIDNLDVLTANEFRTLVNDRFPEGHPARGILGEANTNWQDEIYETAVGHDHNLSLSGGIANTLPYRLSLGYTDKKGVLKTDRFQRKTLALNLSPGFLNNSLQVNLNVKSSFADNHFADRGAIGNAVSFDPTQPIRVGDSPFGGFFTWTDNNGNPNGLAPVNPLALLELKEDNSDVNRYITNASIDYRFGFLPELRANLNLGYDYSKGQGTVNIPEFASFAFDAATGGGVKNNFKQVKKNELMEFYLNYVKEFGITKLDVMGGYSWQRFFFENNFSNSNIAGSETEMGDNSGELFLLSLFGRLNFSIQDKYLFTFTLRRDASSRFSPDTRWGLFPAAAFAWKILDDREGVLNNLKLRLGYGVTGQQDIGGFYEYLPRYLASFDNAQYQFGSEFVTTLRPEGYDANIKWEETTTYNAGIDFGLFDERLYGSFEYYFRKTKDLLNFIPVPAGTNLTNFLDTNVGDLENEGVEFSINAVPLKKDKMTWDFGFNITRNTNKITRLIATDDPSYLGVFTGGISGAVGNTIQIHSVGFPANSFFVYEQVYDNNGVPIEGLYVDRNGDGKISPDDLYRYKKPAPDVFLGFTSNFSYGNFNFSFAGRANFGNYAYNNVQSNQAFYDRLFHSTLFLTNLHSDVTTIDFKEPQYFSDHFIQKASFLRIDHITMSYRLAHLFNQTNSVTISATVQNPFLITEYTGLDPEIFNGIDDNIYPRSRTFLVGVNASF